MKIQRLISQVFVVVLISTTIATYPRAAMDGRLEPHQYLREHGYTLMEGDVHAHSTISDGFNPPDLIAKMALRELDFFFLTEHGEQVDREERKKLVALALKYRRLGKVLGIGHEYTEKGHLLVYGTDFITGQDIVRGGEPDLVAAMFGEFLAWIPTNEHALIAYAHPSEYDPSKSYDSDGDGVGFDGPLTKEELDQIFGCELSSHSIKGYRGLGDGITMNRSNEACFRALLRQGRRLSPLMSTDRHEVLYQPGPYTHAFVKNRSLDGVLDAFYERRTCGSEVPGLSIALLGQLVQGVGAESAQPVLMGSWLNIPDPHREVSTVHLRATVRDRHDKPVKLKQMKYVFVCKERQHDFEAVTNRTGLFDPDHNPDEVTQLWKPHRAYAGMDIPERIIPGEVVAIYAVATLPNGKQLISAPLFVRHQGESTE